MGKANTYNHQPFQKETIKWYTETRWVDIETGEILKEHEAKKNYIVTKNEIKYERNSKHGTRIILKHCKINRQCQFQF